MCDGGAEGRGETCIVRGASGDCGMENWLKECTRGK